MAGPGRIIKFGGHLFKNNGKMLDTAGIGEVLFGSWVVDCFLHANTRELQFHRDVDAVSDAILKMSPAARQALQFPRTGDHFSDLLASLLLAVSRMLRTQSAVVHSCGSTNPNPAYADVARTCLWEVLATIPREHRLVKRKCHQLRRSLADETSGCPCISGLHYQTTKLVQYVASVLLRVLATTQAEHFFVASYCKGALFHRHMDNARKVLKDYLAASREAAVASSLKALAEVLSRIEANELADQASRGVSAVRTPAPFIRSPSPPSHLCSPAHP